MGRAIVVGGGIVGASTAWALVNRDQTPLVLDRRDAGRATTAGAGISYVPPSSPCDPAALELASRANTAYDDVIEALGLPTAAVQRTPMLKVGLSGQATELDTAWEWIQAAASDAEHLSSAAVSRVDGSTVTDHLPDFPEPEGAIRFENGLRIDGEAVTDALLRAVRAGGGEVREADVRGVQYENGLVTGVETAAGEHVPGEQLFITGGAWSQEFGSELGVPLPTQPLRGQIIHLSDLSESTGDWPLVSTFGSRYLVPWPGGRVAIGTTHETAGFDPRATVSGVRELLGAAEDLVPPAADATFDEVRVGLRPRTPDGDPILGRLPGFENAYVATGHGGGGLQRGPISGRLVADLATGNDPAMSLVPFSATRFHGDSLGTATAET